MQDSHVGGEANGCRLLRKKDGIESLPARNYTLPAKGGMGMDGRVESACMWERRDKYKTLRWTGCKYNHNSGRERI